MELFKVGNTYINPSNITHIDLYKDCLAKDKMYRIYFIGEDFIETDQNVIKMLENL